MFNLKFQAHVSRKAYSRAKFPPFSTRVFVPSLSALRPTHHYCCASSLFDARPRSHLARVLLREHSESHIDPKRTKCLKRPRRRPACLISTA